MTIETQLRIGGKVYLTLRGVVERIEKRTGRVLKTTTITTYRSRGTAGGSGRGVDKGAPFPEPDMHVGRTPLWALAPVDEWTDALPGRGAGGGAGMHAAKRGPEPHLAPAKPLEVGSINDIKRPRKPRKAIAGIGARSGIE